MPVSKFAKATSVSIAAGPTTGPNSLLVHAEIAQCALEH